MNISYARPRGGWLYHARDASKMTQRALCGFTPARGWDTSYTELFETDAPLR